MSKNFDVEEKILEKSIDLFYRYGFVKASVREIAKAVGITNSTVYLYFKNKDEILFRIIYQCGVEVLEGLRAVIEGQKDPLECLRAMIQWQVYFSIDTKNTKKLKIFMEEQYRLPPSLKKKHSSSIGRFMIFIIQEFAALKRMCLMRRQMGPFLLSASLP